MLNLNKEELKELRNQIILNSLYYSDYENSFGIDCHTCFDFFEGYMDYLTVLYEDKYGSIDYGYLENNNSFNSIAKKLPEELWRFSDNHFWENIFDFDTLENLWNYQGCCSI